MSVHDSFKTFLYRWYHFIDYFVGLDTFQNKTKIRAYTLFTAFMCASLPIFSIWTFYYDEGGKAIDGGSYFLLTLKVDRPKIHCL